ncbi:MAG TPA: M14 family zinc carboxypeptidase, partial [Fimbriimonadaceae bacterium]|nr:M14 family zinc carboxypeptidase [Fimbriimonadaceae bacterium]
MDRRALLLLALLPSSLAAQPIDEGYTKKIREYTTEPFFLTEMVDHLPASRTVPTPEKILGRIIGTPNHLHYVDEIHGYMRALAKASPRVMTIDMGKSEGGRDMLLVLVSDEANLKNLAKYKQMTALLGDPRKLVPVGGTGLQPRPAPYNQAVLDVADAAAEKLIKEAVPFYWATAGMHSPEAGPPEMVMELAYRLAVSEAPMIQEIRKNSIVMITPVLDPDGRDRYVDTYLYRKKNPGKPPIPLIYWGQYVAHDNNRDGMAISLQLSKNVMKTWFEFMPQVMHDLHESVPYLYISTGTGPYNPWLDPITIDEWHLLAYNEVNEMTRRGVPGVWSHGFYDGWAPNYAFYAANGHNAIGRFYETQGGIGADTRIVSSGNRAERAWFRPNPPFPRVRWSLRNNTNLMQSGVLLGLHEVARNKERYLRNYYLKSKRSVLKAHTEGPAAYVLPPSPGREFERAKLLLMLQRQGIELHELGAEAETKEGKFAVGSVVIRLDQPYSRMADMLLDKQFYSPSDPRPYDDTGWTLGPLFDVPTVRVRDVTLLQAPMNPFRPREPEGDPIWTRPDDPVSSVSKRYPRLALVHNWTNTQDEGWFRLGLEDAKFPYRYVSVHELRDTPNLRAKYDVILLPQMRGSAQSIVNGIPMVGEPIPWKPLEGFRHLGGPDQTDDIRGGIELQGVLHLQRFLNEGGLLICAGNSARIPIDYGLVSGVSISQPQNLVAPGSVYLAENQAKESPVLKGYGDTLGVYYSASGGPIL